MMSVRTASPTPACDALEALHRRLHHLGHLAAIAGWDQATMMPPGGNEARAAALAELAGLTHRLRTDPSLRDTLERARDEDLDDDRRANLREIEREWRLANALPAELVERRQLATSRCEHAWRTQRPANDWGGFLENFREVLAVSREEAARLSDLTGLSRYDALMDRFEPGMTSAVVDRVFGDLRGWLPDLITRVRARQAAQGEPPPAPVGPFPVAAQRALCEQLMGLLGFDFAAGRLDVSAHPFCGGVPEDVRLTTRFREDECLAGLMGTIHETGHARYEQNLPRAWLGQPLAQARSMAVHESQSLAFEMQLARHPGFVARQLAPRLAQAFGAQPAFEPRTLSRLLARVEPGRIRVDADEVTYPAHVLLRWEIERPLIEGEIGPEDIPALWDEKMQALLGLHTRGYHRDGALQDVHWPEGLFGYFPCYTLGAMLAAQWFAALRRARPALDDEITAGDFSGLFGWLREHVWSQGSRWPTDELIRRASGEPLNPAHLRAHLEARYLSDGFAG